MLNLAYGYTFNNFVYCTHFMNATMNHFVHTPLQSITP